MNAFPVPFGFPPGTNLLGKYRVVRELGAGGMGVVLLADHLTLGTRVAIKVLLPELAALPDAAGRFVREARAASRIAGEHVARVLDAGTLPDGLPFMVMEHLEGEDLGRHLKRRKQLPVGEAIDFVVQAAEALSQAHAAGIVHRDVKPSNLFLTSHPDGMPLVKVLDFGISKAAGDDLATTRTNAVMGSALYMSLEQMKSAKGVDHRTDVYALGVSLYELLSGTHPFTADCFSALCVKVSLDPPDPIVRHRPDIPAALAEALAVAYARLPEDRYPTAGAFAAALAPFAEPGTRAIVERIARFEQAHPVTVASGPRASGRRRAGVAGRAAAAALGGLALSIAGWWAWSRTRPEAPLPLPIAPTVEASAPVAPPSAAVIPAVTVAPPASAAVEDAGVDAGKAKPVKPRCPPGGDIILPNGLRRPCR